MAKRHEIVQMIRRPSIRRKFSTYLYFSRRTFLAESSKEFFTAEPSHLSIFTGLSSIFHCNRNKTELKSELALHFDAVRGAQGWETTQTSAAWLGKPDQRWRGSIGWHSCVEAQHHPTRYLYGFKLLNLTTYTQKVTFYTNFTLVLVLCLLPSTGSVGCDLILALKALLLSSQAVANTLWGLMTGGGIPRLL